MRRLSRAVAVLSLLLTGACVAARQPPPPLPAVPDVVVEARLPETLSRPGSGIARELLALAESALAAGIEPGADVLLADLLRAAPEEDTRLRSRALVMRARVAAAEGGEEAGARAANYLEAALQEDPVGASADASSMGLDLLADLVRTRQDLRAARAALAAERERGAQQKADAEALSQQVESLQRQLEELKAVHLRIESEKEEPS